MESSCPNCSEIVTGRYCHFCGQQTSVPRITWRYLLVELQQRLFGFDNRFMRTLKDLTIRPERVIHTVIDGVRVRYFGPLSYYFLMITLYVLLISFMDIDMTEYTRSLSEGMNRDVSEGQQRFQEMVNQSIFSNFRVFSFFMVPFFILGTYIFFRNKKYNFLETSVLVFYAMGHPIILSILMLVPYKLGVMSSANLALPLISYGYYAWICARFYSGNRFWNFVKAVFAIIVSMLLLMFLVAAGMIAYLAMNPSLIENFQ